VDGLSGLIHSMQIAETSCKAAGAGKAVTRRHCSPHKLAQSRLVVAQQEVLESGDGQAVTRRSGVPKESEVYLRSIGICGHDGPTMHSSCLMIQTTGQAIQVSRRPAVHILRCWRTWIWRSRSMRCCTPPARRWPSTCFCTSRGSRPSAADPSRSDYMHIRRG